MGGRPHALPSRMVIPSKRGEPRTTEQPQKDEGEHVLTRRT